MTTDHDKKYMQRAIELAAQAVEGGMGGPFGTVIAKDGQIIAEGYNQVTSSNDPTAHAEIVAIRAACEKLGLFQLDDCVIYTSCEPCPMCLGAIYWARPKAVFYACNQADAAAIDFDDAFIYSEMEKEVGARSIPFVNLMRPEALFLFRKWEEKPDKIKY